MNFFHIQPSFSLSGSHDATTHILFLNAVQQVLNGMIPDSFWVEVASPLSADAISSLFYRLNRMLPIFRHSRLDESANSVAVTYLCPAEYTHGAGRYVIDTLS